MTILTMPWPGSELSGHAKGNWRGKHNVTKAARLEASVIASKALPIRLPETGDIKVTVIFYPPDRRGDRVNFPNRLKPLWDGIADALAVNDARFLPMFLYAEPQPPGRVEFLLGGAA